MENLRKGEEPNLLEILVDHVEMKPFSRIHKRIIEDGIILKFGRYNLEDVLSQMLKDYSKEELIKRIKELA